MPKIIGVVSGKGGVGKTTVTANLGYYLSNMGKDVTILDCNVTTSHLGFNFGLYYYEKTLNNLLRGEADLNEVIYNYKNLKIIPASLSLDDLMNMDISAIGSFVRKISGDYLFLDSAPGLGREPMSVLTATDEVILVTIPYLNAVTDIVRIKKVLSSLNVKPRGLILNMVKRASYELSSREVEKITGIEVLGEIPYDENFNKTLAYGVPLVEYNPSSPGSVAIAKIASKITGQEFEYTKESFVQKLKRGFRNFFLEKRIINAEELI